MNKSRKFGDYAYGTLGHPLLLEFLLPLLKPGQNALDLGIGTGHSCSPLAFAGLNITGVDRNGPWLDICQELFADAGLGSLLTTIEADALVFLRANVAKFHLVTMSDFLMFVPKTPGKEIVKLAYDALLSDGYLWISTMSINNDFYSVISKHQEPIDIDTYTTYSPCAGSGPICFYSPQELEDYLASMGANILFHTETMGESGKVIIVLAQKPQ